MNDRHSVLRTAQFGKGASFTYTGTAGQSGVIDPNCTAVYFWCTTDAWVRTGGKATNPTATTADFPAPANTPLVLPINSANDGDERRISAVQVATGGTCYYCPLV